MRRALLTVVAVPALVTALAACSGDDGSPDPTTPPADPSAATAPGDAADGTAPAATQAPAGDDTAVATATVEPEDVEGGEEGQAAADVAAAFLVAMVNARPEACDHLLSFTDIERPMTAVEADYAMCAELLPEVLRAETEAQGLDAEAAAALEGLVIRGADVDGDTAVVDADNYPPDLATSMGDAAMTLKRVDDRWYVDLEDSFAVPTAP
ncbi:hypothetical protein [Ornithinimicrobium pekingense]|uniref:Nuclear transport factor 2 family protein n=1 Tax=Ornithinimicrobium pekingense TaxID=384677 RepID=A0ABQ2F3J8_9MICO|nr:hypothetical protein [Ornithinimicrobium pekingense]GGK58566.1 hypothetical protein GCM10011509_03690 [Ornithinimicrobium pekingense]